jgi:zinc protease
VCAVAYSACGNLTQSEDVAQETFWTAWRQRATLEQPERLKAWLCGIARNLGRNARRKASRPIDAAGTLDVVNELSSDQLGPEDEAVSHEEESLLWQALERIPEVYREPLILFYREDQSVAQVAGALVLSEEAVKQRLSRGRGMLRERVAELIEGGLRRSRPGRRFTMTVMAGLAAQAVVAKTAVAGTATGAGMWKAAAGAAGAGGALGGIMGTLGGLLLGGWIGTWLPAQAAPTHRERDAILRAGWRILLVSTVFIAALFGVIYAFRGTPDYLIAWGGWMVAFWAYMGVECACLALAVKRIRDDADPNDTHNETAVRAYWRTMGARVGDRAYRSKATLLGLPLIDINWSVPMPVQVGKFTDPAVDGERRIARGWVAIGNDARGVLLAAGSTARGLIALGGRAFGVVSFGGVALGVVAFGGVGLGVLGVGGLGAGVYAFGGGAVGWRSAGGLAIGWDIACGGGAIANRAAIGGAAIAREYAVGGDVRARHANDEAARSVLVNHAFTRIAFTVMGQRQVLGQLARLGAARATDLEPDVAPGRFELENGLTVRVRPIRGARDVTLLVLVKLGGDDDPKGQSGLAHLVEHLYVTAGAGATAPRTAEAFFKSYPAGCNAQTGDRYTLVATVFPRGDLEKELVDASARMGDLRITAPELDREKLRLIDEVSNMFGRLPTLGAVNNARELIRPTPRGGRKGGVPEHVQKLTLDDIQMHWKRYYKPRHAILVLAGAVDEEEARKSVTAHFENLGSGEELPKPGEPDPPKTGAVREVSAKSLQGQPEPVACIAYAAPQPGSELYAPFLVLVARFFAKAAQSGSAGGTAGPSVYFPLLEDPAVIGLTATAKPGENAARAIARLEFFVADTIGQQLGPEERASARQTFALFLGTAEIPDFALAQNPYGVALSLARREQLHLDTLRLNRAFDALTEKDLRRAAGEIFDPARHAGAFVSPK